MMHALPPTTDTRPTLQLGLPPTTDTHPTLELAPGSEIAGCRIDGVAGRGGMGVVYRAMQLDLGRPVAVKVIAADRAGDRDLRARFALESRVAASIDHPNVVPIHAAGEEQGRLYLVMRYVAGTDLQRLLAREGRLSPGRAARIVAQVAAGLDAAHAAGLVHRDVKPANVLIAGEHVYLGDFGLTRLQGSDARITESGAWVGTVDYMSPEHLRGATCDARSDVYALGCLLVAALTGEPPFRRDTVPATMSAHLHEPPPRPSQRAAVPRAFDAVAARALAKRPEDRYPSAGDLGRAALAAASGEPVTEAERMVARGAAAPPGRTPEGAGAPPGRAVNGAAEPPGHTAIKPPTLWHTPATARRPSTPRLTRWRPPTHAPAVIGRRPRRAVLGTLAVAAAAAAATIALMLAGGAPDPAATREPGPLDEGEVRAAVDGFAAAVAAEDGAALSRVLARDVQRVFPNDVQRGRAAVLATYRGQFRAGAISDYAVDDLDVEAGQAGRATGHYKLERAGRPPVGGRIAFGVTRERGRPRIALIAATPD